VSGSRRGKRQGLETLRQKDYRKRNAPGETRDLSHRRGKFANIAGNLSGKRTGASYVK